MNVVEGKSVSSGDFQGFSSTGIVIISVVYPYYYCFCFYYYHHHHHHHHVKAVYQHGVPALSSCDTCDSELLPRKIVSFQDFETGR
jgi:hypothetical protein